MYKKQKIDLTDNKVVETIRVEEQIDIDVEEVLEEEVTDFDTIIQDDEMVSEEEQARVINEAIDSIPNTMKTTYVGNPYFNTVLKKLHSSSWNNMSVKERREVFLELHGYTHYIFGKEVVNDQVMFTEKMVEDEYIYIQEGETYVYSKLFDNKNSGIAILTNYIFALTRDLILTLGDNIYASGINPSLLSTRAREYYENMQSSYLYGSWSNLYSKGEKYYTSQPVIHDSLLLSKEIMIEHVKWLYQEFGYVDKEMSSLINQYMNEINNHKAYASKRREAVMLAKKNIKKSMHEYALYEKYLEQSSSVFSKLTDDEFYELFNVAYVSALNSNEDGKLCIRITNMLTELIKRTFADFDLTNIELPKYKAVLNNDDEAIQLIKVYEGKESVTPCTSASACLSVALNDIIVLAQKHVLFKFASKKEEEDYYIMKEWVDLKGRKYSDQTDKEVVNDGLNIILRKTNELLSDLNCKIKMAISKSKFIPHGKSIITHDNKEALYDYHEFKNLYTKDEVTESLMSYIRLDVEEMKRNNIIKNTGGRK